jgi:hypothetical protein
MVVPIVDTLPTTRNSLLSQLTKSMQDLGNKFLDNTRDENTDKSVIGQLSTSINWTPYLTFTPRLARSEISELTKDFAGGGHVTGL